MNFTIYNKTFKNMIQKVLSGVPKKSSMYILGCVEMEVKNNKLLMTGTDMENYITVSSEDIFGDVKEGKILIHHSDLKLLESLNSDITITAVKEKLIVQSGNKKLSIPKTETDVLPELPKINMEQVVFTCKESWLLETFSDLSIFTGDNTKNEIIQAINFNLKNCRAEANDTYRIGVRTMDKVTINDSNSNVLIHNSVVAIVKKVMDKKANTEVKIFQNEKFIGICGDNFSIIQRRLEGNYPDFSKIIPSYYEFQLCGKVKDFKDVLKYDIDILKNSESPVVLHTTEKTLYTYANSGRYELLDKLETEQNTMDDNLFLFFNPVFLYDALSKIDTEDYTLEGTKRVSPIVIRGDEYFFLVLPVNPDTHREVAMVSCIKREGVA